jgi:hypothetical protein
MRVFFERTGGFAGLKLKGTLDAAALPGSQSLRLKKLLRQSRFFELPESLKSSGPGADRFNYRITVETETGSHTVEAEEEAIPGELRPLLDYLTRAIIAH